MVDRWHDDESGRQRHVFLGALLSLGPEALITTIVHAAFSMNSAGFREFILGLLCGISTDEVASLFQTKQHAVEI